jgi:hypothetical protein
VFQQRSGWCVLPDEADWLEGTRELRKAFKQHEADLLPNPLIQ